MRVINLAAICLALASSFAAASFAQTTDHRAKPTGSAAPQGGATMAPAPSATAKPGGAGHPIRAPGGMTATPLSESECGNLGGSVKAGITACLSGKACQTTGEDKQVHAVCISKQ